MADPTAVTPDYTALLKLAAPASAPAPNAPAVPLGQGTSTPATSTPTQAGDDPSYALLKLAAPAPPDPGAPDPNRTLSFREAGPPEKKILPAYDSAANDPGSMINAFDRGLTYDTSDKGKALVEALHSTQPSYSRFGGRDVHPAGENAGRSINDVYEQKKQLYQTEADQFAKDHPLAAFIAHGAGTLASLPLLGPLGAIGGSAAAGGLEGLAAAPDTSFLGDLGYTAGGAALGAGLGAAGAGIGAGARLASPLAQRIMAGLTEEGAAGAPSLGRQLIKPAAKIAGGVIIPRVLSPFLPEGTTELASEMLGLGSAAHGLKEGGHILWKYLRDRMLAQARAKAAGRVGELAFPEGASSGEIPLGPTPATPTAPPPDPYGAGGLKPGDLPPGFSW